VICIPSLCLLFCARHVSIPVVVGSTDLHPDDSVGCASGIAQRDEFGGDIELNGAWSPIGSLVEVDTNGLSVDNDVNVNIVSVAGRNARGVVNGDLIASGGGICPVPARRLGARRLHIRGSQGALQRATPMAVRATHLNPFNNVTSGVGGSGPVGVQSVIECVSAISREIASVVVEVQSGLSAVGLFDADVAIVALTGG